MERLRVLKYYSPDTTKKCIKIYKENFRGSVTNLSLMK